MKAETDDRKGAEWGESQKAKRWSHVTGVASSHNLDRCARSATFAAHAKRCSILEVVRTPPCWKQPASNCCVAASGVVVFFFFSFFFCFFCFCFSFQLKTGSRDLARSLFGFGNDASANATLCALWSFVELVGATACHSPAGKPLCNPEFVRPRMVSRISFYPTLTAFMWCLPGIQTTDLSQSSGLRTFS